MREYMAKAYDRLEWVYLGEIILKLSFEEGWAQTVMKCVEAVSSSPPRCKLMSNFLNLSSQQEEYTKEIQFLPFSFCLWKD